MNPYPRVFRNFSYLKYYCSSVLFPVHVTVSPVTSFSDLTTCSNLRNCLKKMITIHFSRLVSTYSHTNVLEFEALASKNSSPFTRLCRNIEQRLAIQRFWSLPLSWADHRAAFHPVHTDKSVVQLLPD